MQTVTTRTATLTDAPALVELSAELGYTVIADVITDWLTRFGDAQDQLMLIAECAGQVVGWVDATIVNHMINGRYGEIGGLVVSSTFRGQGIGKLLTEEAEKWIRSRQVQSCLVRSRVTRPDAHRFYEREGYTEVKRSVVFRKKLNSSPGAES